MKTKVKQVFVVSSLWVCMACGGQATTTPAAATTTPGTGPEYQIVLNRPLKAGDKFRIQVEAKEQISGDDAVSGGTAATSNAISRDTQLSLVGTIQIREVDADGRATSALLQVEQFKDIGAGKDIVPTGTSIDAVLGQGKFSMMVNGEPRSDLQRPLRLAFPLHRPGSPMGDELFGSKTPRQVGDTWAFAKSNVAESMLDEGYRVQETAINGDTKLMGTTNVGGNECLELRSTLNADQATIDDQWDVQGIGNGKVTATIKMVVPTDTALPVAMEETTTKGEFAVHLQGDNAASQTAITLTRSRRALYTKMAQ